MGIRFYCPNGHKLNVKEFQAGRRGICPFCGSRTQIPMQSTRPSGKGRGGAGGHAGTQTLDRDDDGEGDDGQGSDSSPDILPGEPPALPGDPAGPAMVGPNVAPGGHGAGPIAAPPGAAVTERNGSGGRGTATASAMPTLSGRPQAVSQGTTAAPTPPAGPSVRPAAAPSPSLPPGPSVTSGPSGFPGSAGEGRGEMADAISEAPEMIWYIRPPSGGQFGPAPGDLMRTWLSEGRVSADSLVWREGWRDWQEAGTVFPKLRGNQLSELLESMPAVTSAAASAHAHRPKTHKSSDNTWITLLTVAVLALVIAISVFLYVLFKP